jgi:menaquinone-dependent protoporphyrinogen IX oxidase
MSCIVLYNSNTGFTKRYADWISEELCCECIPIKKVKKKQLECYSQIICGSWMHAGKIMSLKKINKILPKNKTIIYFATGACPVKLTDIDKIVESNHIKSNQTPFFYYQSGLNYDVMSKKHRFMMYIFRKIIAPQKDSSGRLAKAASKSCDYTKRSDTIELINLVKAYVKGSHYEY